MKSFVYSDSTIAFVTAAAQTCLLIEQTAEHDREEWREQMLRLLPVLYLRARLLEEAQTVMEDEPQRFVSEEDYNFALVGIRNLLGTDDAYLDVFVDQGIYTDEIQTYLSGVERHGGGFPDRRGTRHERRSGPLPGGV